jgi:hypothetical protein
MEKRPAKRPEKRLENNLEGKQVLEGQRPEPQSH